MDLYATEKWVLPSIVVPNLGIVSRPPAGETVVVPDLLGDWLIAEGYATPDAPQVETDTSVPPPVQQQSQKEEAQETGGILAWQQAAVDYLNTAESAQAIDAEIRGIGPKKSAALYEARPLDWAICDRLLTTTQVNALRQHFENRE